MIIGFAQEHFNALYSQLLSEDCDSLIYLKISLIDEFVRRNGDGYKKHELDSAANLRADIANENHTLKRIERAIAYFC